MLSRRDNSCLFPPKLLYCFSQKTDRKGAVITLETAFNEVYTKFKLHFYQEIFRRFQDREASLTTVETFCMESIMALGSPTVNEFATFMRISPPNAAYKVNSLVKKGLYPKGPISGRPPGIPSGGYPEVYRLLQHLGVLYH